MVVSSATLGILALHTIENKREKGAVSSTVRFDEGVERQNRALAGMLKDLPNKTTREKLEAAADAQVKFMAPQRAFVVSQSTLPSEEPK